jgi:DNA-directed RNA polymerase subunit delta
MNSESALNISEEKAQEMPMVDLAFQLLKEYNKPLYYRDLMQEVAKIKGLSEEEINDVIAHLYTEINIDGRFACVGGNMWGLKRWYPLEKSEDAMGSGKRPRIINDDDLDDEDLYEDDSEESFDSEEDFDSIDEDDDDLFLDDEADVDEELELDDEDLVDEEEEPEDVEDELDDLGDDDFEDDEDN